jgi:hypothetical protein
LITLLGRGATAHDTNENLRKPFQFGRGAMDATPYATSFG